MPLRNYGVWKATPTHFDVQRGEEDRSPHGHLDFEDGVSSRDLSSAINVKSLSSDSRLVFWLEREFQHPLTASLKSLPFGFNGLSRDKKGVALDLLRSNVVEVLAGNLVPHDIPGDKNDIVDFLEPFFANAIKKKATMYIYGEQFPQQDGLHDVHMNQGSDGKFRRYNGVYQDGGIIMEFEDGHWEAFFIAFASQTAETDNRGQPKGPKFGDILKEKRQPGGGNWNDDDDENPRSRL